jgi:hypothetical protein
MREEQLTDGTTVIADEAYIEHSILAPNDQIVAGFNPNIMPQNYLDQFTAREEEIGSAEAIDLNIAADIIAYLKTLP